MSEFGAFLENHADSERLTAKEMASRMGVPASMLSQFIVGTKESCRPFSLVKIVSGISTDPAVQAALLQAYLRDQCTTRYKDWIRVVPPAERGTTRVTEDAPEYGDEIARHAAELRGLRLPNVVVRALTAIARAMPGRQKFRVVIEDLGKFATELLADAPPED